LLLSQEENSVEACVKSWGLCQKSARDHLNCGVMERSSTETLWKCEVDQHHIASELQPEAALATYNPSNRIEEDGIIIVKVIDCVF
jgi:hypothetical protein